MIESQEEDKKDFSETRSVPEKVSHTEQMKNSDKRKLDSLTVSILKKIFDTAISEEERKKNPQLIRIKNNLLLILFVLSAYGIYYLIGDFIDIMLTAFIAGIAYQQTRQRFAKILMNKKSYDGTKQGLAKRIIKSICLGLFAFTLPRLRYLLAHPKKIWKVRAIPSIKDFLSSLKMNNNWIVYICQIVLILYIIYLLLGPHLKKIGRNLKPIDNTRNKKRVNIVFLIISFIVTIIAITVIPSILFKQISSVGYLMQEKIQEKLGCQVISLADDHNSSMPYCSEKITSSQNQFIKQTMAEFLDQNKTIRKCIDFVNQMQNNYIGEKIIEYEEIICTWYTFIQKAASYSGVQGMASSPSEWVLTGTNIFKTFFGNLTWIVVSLSSFIFSATTFLTMFYLTTQYFNPENALQEYFSEQKQQLVSSITNLIQATFLIVSEHFIISVFLLELFTFTNINLLVATMLSSMAFFPFFRPWFGILVVAVVRILITDEKYISCIFIVIYYYISEKIYSFHYRKMEIHEIVINMSVLFGIYQFGLAGIFYGPLIIILYKCVEKELMY